MTKPVHAIVSFNLQGEMMLLWIRLNLDKESPLIKVLTCVRSSSKLQTSVVSFRCQIKVRERVVEVGLSYLSSRRTWSLIANNSIDI